MIRMLVRVLVYLRDYGSPGEEKAVNKKPVREPTYYSERHCQVFPDVTEEGRRQLGLHDNRG